MGCVKRVRAVGNYQRPGQAYWRCVKFIRELEPDELQTCIESQGGAAESLKIGDGDDVDAEGEDDEDYLPGGVHYEAPGNEIQRLELQEVGRIAPRWRADQSITNFIYDLVRNTGTKGISTMVSPGQLNPLQCITDKAFPGHQEPRVWRVFRQTSRSSAYSAGRPLATITTTSSPTSSHRSRHCFD